MYLKVSVQSDGGRCHVRDAWLQLKDMREHITNCRDHPSNRLLSLVSPPRKPCQTQVEQLKAFAHRANIEREECLEREKASAREKGLGVETGSSSTRFGGEREVRKASMLSFVVIP